VRVSRIKLCDFRNIRSMELELCENANIIYGDNGQGKTNFIEAVWLFTGAKSFRGAKDSQMIRFDCPQAALELDFFGSGREQQAMITVESRRSASLNEIPLRSAAELAGHFCAVVFSPAHLTLIKNGPQEKRRFIDTSICQIKPKYVHILNQYTRVLDQRNRLLKDMAYETSLFNTLDIWDERLASFAAVVIKTRASFLERLKPFSQEVYAGISRERETLDFHYVSSLPCEPGLGIPEIERQLLDRLQNQRSEDVKARVTICGPHRDDIEITLNGKSARSYGSQGQQRSCVLALKLAECELIRETVGEYPVVLLDDVMSELDVSRRDYLLNNLRDRQLIMTCCDKAYFKTLGRGIGARIQNGEVVSYRNY